MARQVSVLPQIAKVLEKHQLLLNKSDIVLNNTEHGFTENRSTVSALLILSQNWYNATDNSKEGRSGVHALFLDFRKAFDLVDHGILLRKLAELNVNKSFWMWMKSFLEERSQQVKLGDTKSRTVICLAGVPQGSVISPTLFKFILMIWRIQFPGILTLVRVNLQMTAHSMTLFRMMAIVKFKRLWMPWIIGQLLTKCN